MSHRRHPCLKLRRSRQKGSENRLLAASRVDEMHKHFADYRLQMKRSATSDAGSDLLLSSSLEVYFG